MQQQKAMSAASKDAAGASRAAEPAAGGESQLVRALAMQSRLLQAQLQAQRLTAVEALKTEKSVATIRKIEKTRFVLLMAALVGLGLLALNLYQRVRNKYKLMISNIDKVRANKKFDRSSGFAVAWAYEYPRLSITYRENSNFPAACFYAYYSKEFSDYMIANQDALLEPMLAQSELGGKSSADAGEPSALNIICSVFLSPPPPLKPAPITACENPCPKAPTPSPGPFGFISSALGFGTNLGFIGHMAAGSSVAGLVAGAVVGIGIGIAQSATQQSAHNSECQALTASGTPCISSPGTC